MYPVTPQNVIHFNNKKEEKKKRKKGSIAPHVHYSSTRFCFISRITKDAQFCFDKLRWTWN